MKNYKQILEAVNRGIKFALDDFNDSEEIQGQTNSKVNNQYGTKEWLDLMEEVVDLGLPSGTLWCKYNLDVNPNHLTKAKNWYGKYYAWGELEGNKTDKNGKIYFGWSNYKYSGKSPYLEKMTKYCSKKENGVKRINNNENYPYTQFADNLIALLPEDDVAYQFKKCHNFKFHIPTKELCEELITYTSNYLVKNYDPNKIIHNPKNDGGIKNLNGRIFEGLNGNLLFIPAAGYYIGDSISNTGYYSYLWSSSLFLDNPKHAYLLCFYSDNFGIYINYRSAGYNIRPVINL